MMLDLLQKRTQALQQELLKAKQVHQMCADQLEHAKNNLHKVNGHIQEVAYMMNEAKKAEEEAKKQGESEDGETNSEGAGESAKE